MIGDKRCDVCRGTGQVIEGGRWRRCSCTRPSRTVQDLMSRAHERDDRPRLTMADMVRMGSSNWKDQPVYRYDRLEDQLRADRARRTGEWYG